jgi:hypothetical protein
VSSSSLRLHFHQKTYMDSFLHAIFVTSGLLPIFLLKQCFFFVGLQPVTLTFVYVGTTIKDIADISHSGRHFTRARLVSLSLQL